MVGKRKRQQRKHFNTVFALGKVKTERAIANLMNAIEQGIITTTIKQRMIELENTKEDLELKIIKEEMKRPPLTKEGLIFWLHRFRSLDTAKKEHKQRLIDSFVNAVYVYDDKLVLTFNYNEANVTLEEVNGSIIECSGTPEKRLFFESLFSMKFAPYGQVK